VKPMGEDKAFVRNDALVMQEIFDDLNPRGA
jgi:hypothetical protein